MIDNQFSFGCGSTFSHSVWERERFSAIECHVCKKLRPLVVSGGDLDNLPEKGVSTMFKMMDVFGFGFVCTKCVKAGKK